MSNLTSKYDVWHSRKISERGDGSLQPWHKNAANLLPDLNGLSVLEVGCGRGEFACWILNNYPNSDVTGVDFSETAIGAARDKAATGGKRPNFIVGDAQHLKFPNGSFDFVISCECIEHVPRPVAMAKEIARVLKPGGGFVITTENYFNGMTLAWLNSWLRKRPFDSGSGVQPHENFFVFWQVRHILDSAGLRVSRMFSNHFQWLLLPRVPPHRLRTDEFRSRLLNRIFRPFGRHFAFYGLRS